MCTGSNLRSTREAAITDLEKSGSPHLSTTFGISPSLPRASMTTEYRNNKFTRKFKEICDTVKIEVHTPLLPLMRPSTSKARARSGGQPGQSTFVVRGMFCRAVERNRWRRRRVFVWTDKPYPRNLLSSG